MNAIKTKWFEPYTIKNGKLKPSLQILNKRFNTGVYLIKQGSEIIYVGFSGSNLHKTLYRHFQTWNDRAQERKVFKKTGYKIRVIFCPTSKAYKLEKLLIEKYKPKHNKLQYDALLNNPNTDLSEIDAYYKTGSIVLNPGDDLPF